MAVAGLAPEDGDIGHVGIPVSHHGGLRIPSPAMGAENLSWEGGRWKPRKYGASRHSWGLHPAVAFGNAPEDALASRPAAHTRPPLWVTNSGADQVGDTGQHGSAPLPGSTHGCSRGGNTTTRAGPWVLPKGVGAEGSGSPARAAVQAALPSPPCQAYAILPRENPACTAPASIAVEPGTASALPVAPRANLLAPLSSPFPVDGARQEPGTDRGFFHPIKRNRFYQLFETRCNLVDFGDHQKLPA